MPNARYLSDNVFRLLGVGSSLPYRELRRRADGAARAAKVGLGPVVPFADLFGEADLSDLSTSVRQLDNDRERRTALRYMWPLDEVRVPTLVNGGTVRQADLPAEELGQLQFLSAWITFLDQELAGDAKDALGYWRELGKNAAMDARLRNLLVEEDKLEEFDAHTVVSAARKTLTRHLVEKVATVAATAWEAADPTRGTQLIKAIFDSRLDKTLIEERLEPLVECGRRLDGQVEGLIEAMPDWTQGSSVEAPRPVSLLGRLGKLIEGWHPSATDWSDTSERWRIALGWRMREEGLRFHTNGDNEGALAIMEQALALSPDLEQRQSLEEDIAYFQNVLRNPKQGAGEATPKGIEEAGLLPIKRAPIMWTMGGIGTMLYGHADYPPDPRFHFTNLYFTVFLLPIFPISRYLVEQLDDVNYNFHGKARWTRLMKAHMVLICVGGLVLFLTTANTPSSAPASRQPWPPVSSYDRSGPSRR